MATVADLVHAMQAIAPLELAEPWDNVGLLAGSSDQPLAGPVLLTIDLTDAVVTEAERLRAAAVVAYHPPIFDPLKRITSGVPAQRIVLRALRAGLALYSPHTALDAARDGMTDWLADGLFDPADAPAPRSADRRALLPFQRRARTEAVKIVTFLPRERLDDARAALASAGAGRIGRYEVCSFAGEGTGTFLGQEGTSPAVGQAGQLESATEIRLEMVCSREALALALETLRRFHPYEEPAIDVYELQPRPERHVGAGRRLVLDRPASPRVLAQRLKSYLGVGVVHAALATENPVETIGVCCGAGGALAPVARAEGCTLYVTGEMKHHEVMAAVLSGVSVILAGHTTTERGYLPRLADRLRTALPGTAVEVSRADESPLVPL